MTTYDSTINFTLDTICPWTYLAKKRLDEALRLIRSTDASSKVKFIIKFHPYQLYPSASDTGEDKYEWYKKSRYGDSDEKMKMYVTLMTAYGVSAGIDYKFGGTVANTMQAHRVIQHFQDAAGAATANRLVDALYRMYFEEEKHPSTEETLVGACVEAGIAEEEARRVVGDREEGLRETRERIGEQVGNGVDSVPFVLIEGKRRDMTIQGANEVDDYLKALKQVVKESG